MMIPEGLFMKHNDDGIWIFLDAVQMFPSKIVNAVNRNSFGLY